MTIKVSQTGSLTTEKNGMVVPPRPLMHAGDIRRGHRATEHSRIARLIDFKWLSFHIWITKISCLVVFAIKLLKVWFGVCLLDCWLLAPVKNALARIASWLTGSQVSCVLWFELVPRCQGTWLDEGRLIVEKGSRFVVVAVNMMGRVESQNPFHELDRHLLKFLGLLEPRLTRFRCNHKPQIETSFHFRGC